MLRPALLSLATLALLSLPAAADGNPIADLIGSNWQLAELDGAAIGGETVSTLEISADRVGGKGGCNTYGGNLETTPTGVRITQTVSTMMACPGLDQEQAFFAALEETRNFVVSNGDLQLLDADGNILARLTAAN